MARDNEKGLMQPEPVRYWQDRILHLSKNSVVTGGETNPKVLEAVRHYVSAIRATKATRQPFGKLARTHDRLVSSTKVQTLRQSMFSKIHSLLECVETELKKRTELGRFLRNKGTGIRKPAATARKFLKHAESSLAELKKSKVTIPIWAPIREPLCLENIMGLSGYVELQKTIECFRIALLSEDAPKAAEQLAEKTYLAAAAVEKALNELTEITVLAPRRDGAEDALLLANLEAAFDASGNTLQGTIAREDARGKGLDLVTRIQESVRRISDKLIESLSAWKDQGTVVLETGQSADQPLPEDTRLEITGSTKARRRRCKEILAEKNSSVSLTELSKKLGVDPKTLRDWRRNPRVKSLYPKLGQILVGSARPKGLSVDLHKAAEVLKNCGYLE